MPVVTRIPRVDLRWTRGYVAAIALVLVAIGCGAVLRRLPHANLSLLFLLAVLIVAAVWGLWPSIFASALSFLVLNFFFTVPLYSFTIEEEGDLASIIFFLAMAALTANLAARMRNEMAASRVALGRVSTLLDFSRQMAGAANAEDALDALARTLAKAAGARVSVWQPGDGGALRRVARAGSIDPHALDGVDVQAWWDRGHTSLEIVDGTALRALATANGRVGVAAIASNELNDRQRQLIDALCEQAALTVERIALVDDLKKAQVVSETEQLRSALLSSVSHDLRTPLASIIGSVTSVLEYRELLDVDDQQELLQTVLEEAQRLNRYIQNLLDMTRFGRERLELRREWVDINDLVSGALERLGSALNGLQVQVELAADTSLVYVHGALIEQALVNVVDNAASFSQPGDPLLIKSYRADEQIVIDIIDRGPGIPEPQREKIFDMFYSAQQGDRSHHGVGLGLAICSSIVGAHGGTIAAMPGPDGRGTCMRITLPAAGEPIEVVNG